MDRLATWVGYATLASLVLSAFWLPLRANLFPGRATQRLPTWAKVVQSIIEGLGNAAGAVRVWTPRGGLPPGTPECPLPPPSDVPPATGRAPTPPSRSEVI